MPSLDFDPRQYLAANPDVAAAHVDPLAHFLQFGARRGPPAGRADRAGRRRTASTMSITCSTIRTSRPRGVDPFQHFQIIGWQEGRNPNALFDTSGYLATYADVAAAGVNPLDHYNAVGWHEGRDPSVGFDTTVVSRGLCRREGRARQSARALPPVRHPRGPLRLRGRRVGVGKRRLRRASLTALILNAFCAGGPIDFAPRASAIEWLTLR